MILARVAVVALLVGVAVAASSGKKQHNKNALKKHQAVRDEDDRSRMVELEPLSIESKCALCLTAWQGALDTFNAINRNGVRNGNGVITADKTCRSICPRNIKATVERMDDKERERLVCSSCEQALDHWRAQPSKRPFFDTARTTMCDKYHDRRVKADCQHTVAMYAYDVHDSMRNDMSSRMICNMNNLCNRSKMTIEELFAMSNEEEIDLEKEMTAPIRSRRPLNRSRRVSDENDDDNNDVESNDVDDSDEN